MEKQKIDVEARIGAIKAFLSSIPSMAAKEVILRLNELTTTQHIQIPYVKDAIQRKTKEDLYLLLLREMMVPFLWETGTIAAPIGPWALSPLLDTVNNILKRSSGLFTTFDAVCTTGDSRQDFLFTFIPTLMSGREQRDLASRIHDKLCVLLSLAMAPTQFKYVPDFSLHSTVAAKALFFLTNVLSDPTNVPSLLDALAELNVSPEETDEASAVARIKSTAKTLDRTQLCQELMQLLPVSVVVIPTNASLWGLTCLDGTMALNERIITDVSTTPEDKTSTEKEKVACTVYTILHELGHKKLLLKANKGDFSVLTPRYFGQEAGTYLISKGLGLKQTATLSDICDQRADLILNWRLWGTPDFDEKFQQEKCPAHPEKSLFGTRSHNICGPDGRFWLLPTRPSMEEFAALVEKAAHLPS